MVKNKWKGNMILLSISIIICTCAYSSSAYAYHNKRVPNVNSTTNNKDKDKFNQNTEFANPPQSFPSWNDIEDKFNQLVQDFDDLENDIQNKPNTQQPQQQYPSTVNNSQTGQSSANQTVPSNINASINNNNNNSNSNSNNSNSNSNNTVSNSTTGSNSNPEMHTVTQENDNESQDVEEDTDENMDVTYPVLTGDANEREITTEPAQVVETDKKSSNTKYIVWTVVLSIGAISIIIFVRRARKSDKSLLNNMIMNAPNRNSINNDNKDQTVVENRVRKNTNVKNFYNVEEEKKIKKNTVTNMHDLENEAKPKKKTKLELIKFNKKQEKMEDFEIEVS